MKRRLVACILYTLAAGITHAFLCLKLSFTEYNRNEFIWQSKRPRIITLIIFVWTVQENANTYGIAHRHNSNSTNDYIIIVHLRTIMFNILTIFTYTVVKLWNKWESCHKWSFIKWNNKISIQTDYSHISILLSLQIIEMQIKKKKQTFW